MQDEKRKRLQDLIELRDSGVAETTVDGVTTKFLPPAELNRRIVQLETELGLRPTRRGVRSAYLGSR